MSAPRIALVGFGRVAARHAEVLRSLGADLVAACCRSEAGRARARSEAGIERSFADPVAMVEQARPDGVLVLTSVLSTFEVARDLVPLGRALLVEKPPGTSLAEAEQLAELSDRHATPVMVGLNRRFYSVHRKALELLGGTESLTAVAVEWSEDPGAMRAAGHPERLLPRLVFANSLHGLDLLTFLAGNVDAPRVWGRDLDDAGGLRWQMELTGQSERGTRVRFSSSWDTPVGWRLVAEAAGARLVSAPLETAVVHRRGADSVSLAPDDVDVRFKPGFHAQAAAFLRVVRGEGPLAWPACSIRDALPSMRHAEALTQACRPSP